MVRTMFFQIILCCSAFFISCGDNGNNGNAGMDTSVIGFWEGAMEPIPFIGFHGAKIFNHITTIDSAFTLITLDTTRDTTLPIRDTTLVLAGHWRLNTPEDSILLLPDTCRIIDTAANALVPRPVQGETIPMPVTIVKNEITGTIEWTVAVADLVPLAPLLGMNLSGIQPGLLQAVRIVLFKRWQ